MMIRLVDRFQSLPAPILAAIATALLLEAAMFLILASERLRARIGDCCPPSKMAVWLLVSAIGPYLIYSIGTGTFGGMQATLLIALAGVAAFWFVVIPRSDYADIAFAVFMSAVMLSGAMKRIYLPPAAKLPVEFLGEIMWARIMMAAVLLIRKMGGVNLGLWPNRREWAIGFRHYLYFLPIAAALNFALDFARPRVRRSDISSSFCLCGSPRGTAFPGCIAARVDACPGESGPRAGDYFDRRWPRTSALPAVPELEIRYPGRRGTLVLRKGVPASGRSPRRHGLPRLGEHHVEGVSGVNSQAGTNRA